jgi:hypothetical protein
MKRVKINHIYDNYGLYQLTFGSDLETRAAEARMSAKAADNHYVTRMGAKGSLRVLELFSGSSQHKSLFMSEINVPVEYYMSMDNQPGLASDEVIIGDARTSVYPCHPNLILAYYYSINSTCSFNRTELKELFANVLRNLASGGAFWFNLGLDSYRSSLSFVGVTLPGFYYVVPPNHLLRKTFNLPPYDPCLLQATIHREYNRKTCHLYHTFEDVSILLNGKKVVRIDIRDRFVERMWSETEVVEVLNEVGFADMEFYHVGSGGTGYAGHWSSNCMSPIVKEPYIPEDVTGDYDEGDAVENFMTTDILAIAP